MGPEKSLAECTFEEPPARCSDHSLDVAIKCTNNPPAEPPLGSLRIVDETGAPSTTGVGRLQFYNNGKPVCESPASGAVSVVFLSGWGSVCSDGWTKESEKVACLEMGYTGLKVSICLLAPAKALPPEVLPFRTGATLRKAAMMLMVSTCAVRTRKRLPRLTWRAQVLRRHLGTTG